MVVVVVDSIVDVVEIGWFCNVSLLLLLEDVGKDDKPDSCLSRINFIRSRGIIILSLLPWI
jgi:hypothetical protein